MEPYLSENGCPTPEGKRQLKELYEAAGALNEVYDAITRRRNRRPSLNSLLELAQVACPDKMKHFEAQNFLFVGRHHVVLNPFQFFSDYFQTPEGTAYRKAALTLGRPFCINAR